MFAAVDADARLWDADGVWLSRAPGCRACMRWRRTWQVLAARVSVSPWPGMALPLVLALALALRLPAGLPAAPGDAGRGRGGDGAVTRPRSPWLLVAALLLGCRAPRGRVRRAAGAGWCWPSLSRADRCGPGPAGAAADGRGGARLGAPLDAPAAAAWMASNFWSYLRGAANVPQPRAARSRPALRRVAARERRAARLPRVAARGPRPRRSRRHRLRLAERRRPARRSFARRTRGRGTRARGRGPGQRRRCTPSTRSAAALAIAPVTEPHAVQFSPEGPWRGERHRLTTGQAPRSGCSRSCCAAVSGR